MALSFTGEVFGMGQMDVNPPAAAARASGLDGLGVLEARLAQVHVHVDEARRDDQARWHRRLRRPPADKFGADAVDDAVFDPHVGDAVVTRRRDRSRGRS